MNYILELKECQLVNHLWPELLEKLGSLKATQIVRQAIDLQNMRGKNETLPVLFVNTGGVALTSFKSLRIQTGLSFEGDNKVLLYCPKNKLFQILHEIKN